MEKCAIRFFFITLPQLCVHRIKQALNATRHASPTTVMMRAEKFITLTIRRPRLLPELFTNAFCRGKGFRDLALLELNQ